MNQLPTHKVAEILRLAKAGKTGNAISRYMGISVNTVARYYPTDAAFCQCGQEAGHVGWCAVRYADSPTRQSYLGHAPRIIIPHKPEKPMHPFTCRRCGNGHSGIYIRCGPRVRKIVMGDDVPKLGPFPALCRTCQRELALKGSLEQLLIHDLKRYGRHIANGHKLWSFHDGNPTPDEEDCTEAPDPGEIPQGCPSGPQRRAHV